MWFERKQLKYLEKWKAKKNRKPLIIRGARQVGKTTLIQQYSKQYKQVIFLNLEKKDDASYFTSYHDVKNILSALLLNYQLQNPIEVSTLVFIDEIQEVPEAIAALRYFYEDLPHVHVIAAGSLLEHSLRQIKSFPVGRVEYMYLFPLNFQEFLAANGLNNLLNNLMQTPVDKATHHVAKAWFHKYAMIGGMPEVVQTYLTHEDVTELPGVYESIWTSYRDDVVKYAKNQTEEKVIKHILKTAAAYIDSRITFQGFGASNYRSREIGESFRALDDAKVIQLIYPCVGFEPPQIADYKKSPRMQFLDTGLINHQLGLHAQLMAIEDLSTAYKGALLPHLITQELISMQENSYQKPHFWVRQKKDSQAEIDLVYTFQNRIIPIEIKSGKIGKLRSLHQFLEMATHNFAVRIYGGDFSIENHTTPSGKPFVLMNLPYYLTTFLEDYLNKYLPKV